MWLQLYGTELWKTIPLYQLGFRPGCSTHVQIYRCLRKMHSGKYYAAVFLDLTKAYDLVDRNFALKAVQRRIGHSSAAVGVLAQLLARNKIYLSNDLNK